MKTGWSSEFGAWRKELKNMCKISCILLAGLMILAGCSEKSESLIFSGTIEATEVDVNSEISGKVVEVLKDEGSSVSKDEMLASVDSSAVALQVQSAEAALKAAQAKLEELQAGSRGEEIKQAEAAVKAAKAKLDELRAGSRDEEISKAQASYLQAEEAVNTAQRNYDYRIKNLEKYQELEGSGGVSEQQVDDAQNLADSAYQQLVNAKAQLEIAKEQVQLLKNGATEESIRAAQASYEQAIAKLELVENGATAQTITQAEASVEQAQATLDTAKLQLDKYRIKSPVEGVLLYKDIELGQYVSPGTIIGTVQTVDSYWIKIYVPQKYNGKVALHQKVRVTTSSLSGENIDGTVIFKSPRAEFTPKNVETTESKEENTVIAVKIRVDSHTDKLSPGMTANVYID
ncbi:HlyD family efflux transporter periplasmic adaptor subunit [Petroclostridium sp. X23]|uniref:HlyD family secretion protein n=1 Tax=Petroclostridium sp. X23 TaxID=3045146 RepID=UPI0024ACE3A9|nr:HlyD family efflux transporter periplasmic adaptor subunit [Petroclostridium sp. X23]WHH61562.1 HlyD family efflux transporter periplasmic adaptor subunit [Petroclostridium sp. X23]